MQDIRTLTVISGRKKVTFAVDAVLYVRTAGRHREIHTSDGQIYATRSDIHTLADTLGDGFVRIDRGCYVAARAIHEVTDRILLVNGEILDYADRHRAEIVERVQDIRRGFVEGFARSNAGMSPEDYHRHFQSFDTLPCAFCDIEMVFDEQQNAVDWIFRYANEPLAKLERVPLDRLVGSSFGALFANMDHKWLRLYERATLFGEALETLDYSREIDTWLKITCFPTLPGHCGCLLYRLEDVQFVRSGPSTNEGILRFLTRMN